MAININGNDDEEGKDNQIVKLEENHQTKRSLRGKSCKGCLYYSSVINSKSQSPFCIGLARSFQQGLRPFSLVFV